MPRELHAVNVEEGFLPQFTEAFRDRYGPDSMFVRATADMFTIALSKLLSANGRLSEQTTIPVLATEAARESVARIVRTIWAERNLLLGEACGDAPIGSFASAVDERFGADTFSRWLSALEAQDYVLAGDIVCESGPGADA